MEDRVRKLETEIEEIEERNRRVEADKAWETSWFRIFSITIIIYVVSAFVFYLINVSNFLIAALIPALGYFLSEQSLPFIKRWWISRRLENDEQR